MVTLREISAESWSGHGLTITVAKSDTFRANLRLVGDVDLCSASLLRAALEYQLASGRRYVRLDLSGVALIDSAGMTVLADLHAEFLARRGTMIVIGAGPRLWRLFTLVGLSDELLLADTFSTPQAAVPVA